MEQFRFAQKAFIVNEGKLLLVKKSADDPFHPNEWEVPGGRMEFGEKLDEHIKREVKEEVGLDIIPGEPFAMWTWILEKRGTDGEVSKSQVVAVGSRCEAINFNIDESGRVEDDFLTDTAWVPFNEVLKYNLISDIVPAIKKFIERYTKE
ncbi:MAG: NUDIX domain-containing protein [Oscillospiraceae bacterium]|nr:NUDIX domain-containing protein [Oscillospiraceae bacterium]